MHVNLRSIAVVCRPGLLTVLAILAVSLAGSRTLRADELTGPTPIDRHVTHVVTDDDSTMKANCRWSNKDWMRVNNRTDIVIGRDTNNISSHCK